MKLFIFCILIAVLGVARGVDVKCQPQDSDDTFCKVTTLVTVKTGEKATIISDVNLSSIREIIFYPDKDQRSQISTVPKGIFEQLPNLEIFQLHATVSVLNEGDFEKAGKLQHLAIGNQLKTIPAGVLGAARKLEGLHLSNNKIAEIEDNAFSGLRALFYIDLRNNSLTIIKQNTLNGLENLEILYLDSNQIESIEENALNLPNLRKLHVSANKLTSVSDNVFLAVPSLDHLDVERNQINHIGKSLHGLNSLSYLFLSHNKLVDVDLVALSQLPQLKALFLDDTGLTSEVISKIEIEEQSKSVVRFLTLANNELTDKDDWKKLAIFPQLEYIEVQNTKYSEIDLGDKTLRQKFPKLIRVYISSGQWNCDWLKGFVASSKKDGIDIETIKSSNTNDNEINGIVCV